MKRHKKEKMKKKCENIVRKDVSRIYSLSVFTLQVLFQKMRRNEDTIDKTNKHSSFFF